MSTDKPPLFVTLPEDRELLWTSVARFLAVWRRPLDVTAEISPDKLETIESGLGFRLPAVLREFYSLLGNRLGISTDGYLNDEVNGFYSPGLCRIETKSGGNLEHPILVIGDDYWGGLWGIRLADLELENPPISFVDSCAAESRLFPLSEFLIGMLFRSAILAAPICLRVEKERLVARHELTDRIHEELKARFPVWQRSELEQEWFGNGELGCGLGIEGPGLIAEHWNGLLSIGLLDVSVIKQLGEPLRTGLSHLHARGQRTVDPIDFRWDGHFWRGSVHHGLFGKLTVSVVSEGSGDTLTAHQLATVKTALALPPEVRRALDSAADAYCREVGQLVDLEEEFGISDVTPETVSDHFQINELMIPKYRDKSRQVYFLRGDCDWDPEHGIEFVLDGKTVYCCRQQTADFLRSECSVFALDSNSYAIQVFCQDKQPVTRREIAEFVQEGVYFETVSFHPPLDSPDAEAADWDVLEIRYDNARLPVLVRRHVGDVTVEMRRMVVDTFREHGVKRPDETAVHMAGTTQVFELQFDREGGISEDCWTMLDCLETHLARSRKGLVFSRDDGIYDADLNLIGPLKM